MDQPASSIVGAPSSRRPVLLWAAVGVVCLLLQAYVYIAWMRSADFRPVDPGPDVLPSFVAGSIKMFQTISLAALTIVVAWFVWSLVKTRRLDAAKMMMIGWVSAYWLDPWLDFLRPMFTYNAYAVNFGCWCRFIPGWRWANGGRIAEPLLIDLPNYFFTFTGTSFAALGAMVAVRRRWPTAGWPAMALTGFTAVWATNGLLDVLATRYLHFDSWPGVLQRASLWGGRFYQFPVYEFLLFPSTAVAGAFLLLHRDAQGLTPIEGGVSAVTASGWGRTALRLLTFVAFCNVVNLIYTTGLGLHALFVDPWPSDMPSWLSGGR